MTKKDVQYTLDHGYGASAASFLIHPSIQDFNNMVSALREGKWKESKKSYAGPDEQLITSYISSKY